MFNKEVLEVILKAYNLTYREFLVLFTIVEVVFTEDEVDNLLDKNIGFLNKSKKYCTSLHERLLIKSIIKDYYNIENMEKVNLNIDPKYLEIVEEMQKLYPSGKRPGCSVQWRGNKVVLAKKLMTLVTVYGAKFTKEEAINATKRYVDSFHGDYTYMECLEYFILRLKPELKSNFLSYLENNDDTDSQEEPFIELR